MKVRRNLTIHFLICLIFAASLSAATVDGIQLHSSTHGKGPKTIILVHGWTCDETSWQFQVPELAKHYRVITIDLPGHGQSGSPKDGKLSMNLFARAVEAVRSEAKIDHIVLAGHSMGTPVIIQYARLYPAHVIALVFVDGAPVTKMRAFIPPADSFVGTQGLKNRESMIRGMFSTATTADLQKKILTTMLSAPEATAVGALQAFGDPSIYKEDVFEMPVLGLYADKEYATESDLKPRFPKLEFHKIPGTGHFLMMEKPLEFNRLLTTFLEKQKF